MQAKAYKKEGKMEIWKYLKTTWYDFHKDKISYEVMKAYVTICHIRSKLALKNSDKELSNCWFLEACDKVKEWSYWQGRTRDLALAGNNNCRICRTCIYWKAKEAWNEPYLDLIEGKCRRHAPICNDQRSINFPVSSGNFTCGDWTPEDGPFFDVGIRIEKQIEFAAIERERWLAEKKEREADLVESLGSWYDK